MFTFGQFQNDNEIVITKKKLNVEEKQRTNDRYLYLFTIGTVSFQFKNEPVNNASLSLGDAGYLNTTGMVVFSLCISACTACCV